MPQYIWQLPAWPLLQWNVDRLLAPLAACRKTQGALRAKLEIAGLLNSPTSEAAAQDEIRPYRHYSLSAQFTAQRN